MKTKILSYKESVLNGELDARFEYRNIMFRDIASIGASKELRALWIQKKSL